MQGFPVPQLEDADVKYWNGVLIERAVDVNAARFAGSNTAARHARGVESLTLRPLRIHLPPDEEWVDVGYVGTDGVERELRQSGWSPTICPVRCGRRRDQRHRRLARARPRRRRCQPCSDAAVRAQRGRTRASRGDTGAVDHGGGCGRGGADRDAWRLSRPQRHHVVGTFGHVRIFTFSVEDPAAFVNEFIRLITLLPQEGLILDVRQRRRPHLRQRVHAPDAHAAAHHPEPVQFIATPLNLRIVAQHKDNPAGIDLGPWFRSLDQATETGATFSHAVPITPEDGANEVGQVFQGPVVLVTDALLLRHRHLRRRLPGP